MSMAEKVFDSYNQGIEDNIHTAFPAKVVSVSGGTCTVQPLFIAKNGLQYPQIQRVPIPKWRYSITKSVGTSEPAGDHTHSITNSAEASHTHSVPEGAGTSGAGSSHTHSASETSSGNHVHGIVEETVTETITLMVQPGDVVLCVACERSMDSVSSGQVHRPQSKRQFDLTDSVVVAILY